MEAKTKKRLIIWFSVGSILAIGGFFTIKHFIAKKAEKKRLEDEAVALMDSQSTNVDSTNVGSTNVGSTNAGSTIDRPSDIKAFQDWMDKQGKGWISSNGKWVLLNKGGGYGSFGPATRQAWKVYGSQFLANPQSSSTTAITDKLAKLKTFIPGSVNGKGTDGRLYLMKQGNKGQYYWFEDNTFAMQDNVSKTWKVKGIWGGDLAKTVSATTGPNAGKTFTHENPLMAIYESSIDSQPAISNDKAALYAEKLLSSMQGAGTIDVKFWETMKNIKNALQWRQVFDKFGKPQGSNLDEWINGDIEGSIGRGRWNDEASGKGIPLKLNVMGSTINERTV